MFSGIPCSVMTLLANASSASMPSSYCAAHGASSVERRDLRARAAGEDRHEPEVVHVLVGDDDELEVLDAVAVRGERALERVERRAGVRPAVEQRQRVVLDEVRVDEPDLKRRRDLQPVDARVGGPRERVGRVGCVAHERMIPRISSRRRSMSSCDTSDSRHRRSSGSVFDERTLKCQSS